MRSRCFASACSLRLWRSKGSSRHSHFLFFKPAEQFQFYAEILRCAMQVWAGAGESSIRLRVSSASFSVILKPFFGVQVM